MFHYFPAHWITVAGSGNDKQVTDVTFWHHSQPQIKRTRWSEHGTKCIMLHAFENRHAFADKGSPSARIEFVVDQCLMFRVIMRLPSVKLSLCCFRISIRGSTKKTNRTRRGPSLRNTQMRMFKLEEPHVCRVRTIVLICIFLVANPELRGPLWV